MSSNFLFLAERFPALEKMGNLAEIYLYTDPNTCLYKMGSLAETIVNYIFEIENLTPPSGNDNTHANRIKLLQKKNMLSNTISNIFYVLRINRNEAVHAGYDSIEECITLIEMAYTLSVWFMQIYGDNEYEPLPFVALEDFRSQANYQELIDENKKLSAELEKAQAAALSKPVRTHIHTSELRQRAEKANRRVRLSDKETSYIIDVLTEQSSDNEKQRLTESRKSFRRFLLQIMGVISILVGPLILFTASVTHRLAFPKSLSETAAYANGTGAILPFCIGALAVLALVYAIVYAHDKLDKLFTIGMAAGFTVVAMQPYSSAYTENTQIGLLGASPLVSNILHISGYSIGFGCMILWIMLSFGKSDRRTSLRTQEKRLRNTIYYCSGIAMMMSLTLFIFNSTGLFGDAFPVVFAECAMLLFGGISCLIKGGLLLRDKT